MVSIEKNRPGHCHPRNMKSTIQAKYFEEHAVGGRPAVRPLGRLRSGTIQSVRIIDRHFFAQGSVVADCREQIDENG